MWSLVAARLPPGEPREEVLHVFSKHNISFQMSTDVEDLYSFLMIADFKNNGIQSTPLTNNSLDQVTSDLKRSVANGDSSSCFPEHSLDQDGPFTSFTNVPKAFSKIPNGSQTTDSFSRQLLKNNTVTQKPLFCANIPTCVIRNVVPRRQREEINSVKGPIESNNSYTEPHVTEEPGESKVDETTLPLSADRFLHKAPANIFEDIKPPIDLKESRVVTAEIDLTEDLNKVKEEMISDKEMEEYEEMKENELEEMYDEGDISDSGAHLDPKDMGHKLKDSSLKKNSFVCDACHKFFSDRRNHARHMQTHTGTKPFQCNICQKEFSLKKNRERHMLIHTGEKQYECDLCKKRFGDKGNFNRHLRIHTGEKPYKCDVCGAEFARSRSLKNHCSRLHL